MIKDKICISRIDRMGDMLLTLPVIKSIKNQLPQTEIHVLASHRNAKVLKNIKYIDKVLVIKDGLLSTFKEINTIKKNRYKFFFNFSPGIKSFILCIFSNSINKANLILLSRYNKLYSKSFIRFFTKIFCSHKYIVDRIYRLENNLELHQTLMMFNLLEVCGIKNKKKYDKIDIDLPKDKITFPSKKIIMVHVPDKWINKHYSENNLIDLLSSIRKKNYFTILTTDNSTKNKFIKIYENYEILSNSDLINNKTNKIIILDKLEYKDWIKVICSSNVILTPECGCSHIASACKIPVNIIYDASNYPSAIYKEYSPWKNHHNKFVFDEKNLNKKILEKL